MLFPYQADVVMYRWPIANWVIIGINIVAFLFELGANRFTLEALMLNRADPHISQFFTNIFMHGNFWHLLGNMVFLFVFGNAVNAKLGQWRYVGAYLLAGLIADLAWLTLGSGELSLGASGAIMGVVGLFAVYYPRNDILMFWFFLFRWGTFEIAAIWLILIYFGFDLWGMMRGGEAVAYVAHITGALFGFGLGCLLIWKGWVGSEDQNERNILQVMGVKTP